MEQAEVGIIGGSGLYQMEGFDAAREVAVDTPFGAPSDRLMVGRLEGRSVAFLARHARGHRILPSEVNFQANVFALKLVGVQAILSVSAVGSLKRKDAPLPPVTADQILANLVRNAATAKAVLRAALRHWPSSPRICGCRSALKQALVTPAELVPETVKRELAPIIGKYMK